MFVKVYQLVLLLIVFANTQVDARISERNGDIGLKTISRLYEECNRIEGGLMSCLKKKAVLFFDRASRIDSIPLVDGVNIIKNSEPEIAATSEADIEASLPRSLEAKDEALSNMLMGRIASFANSRTIQLSLPKMSSAELGRGLEEGRGKMKKMMGMMAMGFAMKLAAMVPVAIAGLFILAGKALIVSKIALLLSGIIALKKIIAQKNGSGGGDESHGWSSGGSGQGGWHRRSMNDVSDLAYPVYKQNS